MREGEREGGREGGSEGGREGFGGRKCRMISNDVHCTMKK